MLAVDNVRRTIQRSPDGTTGIWMHKLLWQTSQAITTLPVDRIYALLGLKSTEERAIVVDYTKHPSLLFLETTFHIIDADQSLDVLVSTWPQIKGAKASWSSDFANTATAGIPLATTGHYTTASGENPAYRLSHSSGNEVEIATWHDVLIKWFELRNRGSVLHLHIRVFSIDSVKQLNSRTAKASAYRVACATATEDTVKRFVRDYVALWLASSDLTFPEGDPRGSLRSNCAVDVTSGDELDRLWPLPGLDIRFDLGLIFREWRRIIDRAADAPVIDDLGACLVDFCTSLWLEIGALTQRRAFFVTTHGLMGIGPQCARPGDAVVSPLGASVPFVLRRQSTGCYEVVGDAYVDGIMSGEMLKLHEQHPESMPVEEFVLV